MDLSKAIRLKLATHIALGRGSNDAPAGQLKCHVDPGLSFIVGSSRQMDCRYMPGRRRRA